MEIAGEWYEARATSPGVVARASGFIQDVPPNVSAHEGVFNLVVEDEARRIRRLPAFYLRGALVYAHRDVERLYARLERTVEAIRAADDENTYIMHACEIGGKRGLYARDMNGRSVFRRKLVRAGLNFASDPFVTFDKGEFGCRDWGEFAPQFMIAGFGDEDDPSRLLHPPGGETLFDVTRARFGAPGPAEFRQLAKRLQTLDVVTSADPSVVAAYLSTPR